MILGFPQDIKVNMFGGRVFNCSLISYIWKIIRKKNNIHDIGSHKERMTCSIINMELLSVTANLSG